MNTSLSRSKLKTRQHAQAIADLWRAKSPHDAIIGFDEVGVIHGVDHNWSLCVDTCERTEEPKMPTLMPTTRPYTFAIKKSI